MRSLGLGLVVAGVLVASGCGSGTPTADPTPIVAPSSPGAASSVSDPAPTAPLSSAPANETAEQFIRRWYVIETQMENTGDIAPYREMAGRCKVCMHLAHLVERYYAAGGWVRFGGSKITNIADHASGGTHILTVQVDSAPTTYKESRDGPIKHYAGGKIAFEVHIRRRGETWAVVDRYGAS